jgi:hypothetical protein
MSAKCHKRTHALQQFCLTWSAWPSVAKGECLCGFQEGFLSIRISRLMQRNNCTQ